MPLPGRGGKVGRRRKSRKSVRWSALSVAPKLVYVGCGGERGSGPEEPMTYAGIEARVQDSRLGFEL